MAGPGRCRSKMRLHVVERAACMNQRDISTSFFLSYYRQRGLFAPVEVKYLVLRTDATYRPRRFLPVTLPELSII